VWCFQCRWRLSRYLDAGLSESEIREVDKHLVDCGRCREEWDLQKAAKQALQSLGAADPGVEAWNRMEAVLSDISSRSEEAKQANPRSRITAWRMAGASGLVVAVGVLVLVLEPFARKGPGLIKPAYALDYGLFLEGIAGRSERLEQFARDYDFRVVDLAEVKRRMTLPVKAPRELPGGLPFHSAHLLKSGCCMAVALKYGSGRSVAYVFEQPPGHPSFFGDRKVRSSPPWCDSCKVIRDRSYQAVYWEQLDKGFVIVANLPETELAPVVAAFRAAPIE